MKKIKKIDFLIVGAGFFGAVLAERIANVLGKNVLILDKRNHIGGNCYSELDKTTGIEYHKYGTHIFHTKKEDVWSYINDFTKFNIGIGAGLGYEFTENLYAQFRTTYQLNNYYTGNADIKSRINFFNVGLGYKF